MSRRITFVLVSLCALCFLGVLDALPAHASTGGDMPWDGPLEQLVANLSGPTARKMLILAIVGLGFGFAFSEGGHLFRKVLYIAAGIVLIASAASWVLPFFGFAEAATGRRAPMAGIDPWTWGAALSVLVLLGVGLGLHMDAQEQRRLAGGQVPEESGERANRQ